MLIGTGRSSALCLAIENNKLDVVKALLSRRFPADLNLLNVRAVQQFEGWKDEPYKVILYSSAMQCAAATGRFEIAEYLIGQGAQVNLVAGYYGSPLQAAALRGHTALVSLLLSSGAEPNSQGGYYGESFFYTSNLVASYASVSAPELVADFCRQETRFKPRQLLATARSSHSC